MIRILTAAFFAAFVVLAGCATVDQNVAARKNLEKCTYAFSGLEVDKLHYDSGVPESVDMTVLLAVTNPNSSDVVLDHIDADLYLEQKKVGNIQHKNFVRIAAKSSSSEKVEFNIPFSDAWLLAGKRPELLTIDAMVYVNILIGNFTLAAPMEVPVKKVVHIPWGRVDAETASRKNAVGSPLEKSFKK
jgi:LEA14-like dessication related protein